MSQFKRNLAITIGINKYQSGITSLATAVNDAAKIAQILEQEHGYQVWGLLDEQATLKGCLSLLEEFLPQNVTESDRLIFYFAGHGIALNSDDGLEGFLIPQDAKLGDTSTYLPMVRLQKALNDLPCRHFLCILDCCFAGAFRWSSTRDLLIVPEVIHQERYDRFIEAAAWQVLTSTSHNQLAADVFNLEDDRGETDNHHSPFAAALIEALQGDADSSPPAKEGKPPGDGVITATELYLYLRDRVETTAENNKTRQTPGLFPLNKHDRGEYIFLTPGHELNLPLAPSLDESSNPYRGLESFDESDSSLFFGRQILSEKLYRFCQQRSLTVVLGASGTGKSSLVKAGLIPYVRSLDEQWAILTPIRPGESPFLALRDVLAEIGIGNDGRGEGWFALVDKIWQHLNQWTQDNPDTKLLIVIDQIEELFTLCRNELERSQFLSLLSKAIATYPQLHLVLTLRSDFEPQLRTELEPYWNDARFVVPAMTREELREAIEKPASERVMYFDPPSLVDRLIDEVIQMPGAMPLLSFALSELYLKYLHKVRQGKRDKRAITEADYDELGGVARSLTLRADEEYQKLVQQDPTYQQIVCQVMLRMLAVDGGNIARRRVFLKELEYPQTKQPLADKVIDRFLNARLLVSGSDTTGENYIEPAHDALVRGWQRFLIWQQQEQENLVLQRRLTRAAFEWQQQQKLSFLWHGDPRLNLLRQVLKSNDNWFNQLESEFVRRSIRQKRRNVIGRWSFVTGAFVTVLVFYQLSVLLEKAGSVKNLLTNKPVDALAIAIETMGQNRLLPLPVHRQVQSSLLDAVQEIRERRQLIGHEDKVNVVAYSPDGSLILTGSSDNTLRLWNSQGEPIGQPLQGHSDAVTTAAISPNGEFVVSGSKDKTIRLWDRSDNPLGNPFVGHTDTVTAIAFSPNGNLIASSSDDATIRLWDINGNPLGKPFIGHEDAISAIAFSPDGNLIASASKDRTVRIWNLQGNQVIRPWRKHQDIVNTVAFSPDGRLIASGGDDEKIRLWDLQGNEVFEPLVGHVGIIWSLAFSQNGETIVSASSDRTIRFWDLQGNEVEPSLRGHLGLINSVAISPDGSQVVSSSNDNTVRLWNVDDNPVSQVLQGHQGHVKSVTVSADGKLIVSAGQDATVRLWNGSGILVNTFSGHQDVVNTVAIDMDARLIISGSKDKTIRLWDKSGNLINTLTGYEAEVTSVAVNKDLIVSGSEDKTIRLWDKSGNLIATLTGHEAGVTSIAFSPDGSKIASASRDRTVRIWDLNSKQELNAWSKLYDSEVTTVNFSPDGNEIISGSRDGTMRLIGLKNNSVGRPFIGHEGIVNSAVFSPNGKHIISGSRDQTVRIWDTKGNLVAPPFRGHEGYVDAVAVNPEDNKIISASWDGTLRIWSTKREEWLKAGCDRLKNHAVKSDRQTKFWCKN